LFGFSVGVIREPGLLANPIPNPGVEGLPIDSYPGRKDEMDGSKDVARFLDPFANGISIGAEVFDMFSFVSSSALAMAETRY
jgi:hypothetical protein